MRDEMLLGRAARNAFRNGLVRAKTKRGRFEHGFINPRRDLSDGGKGAAAIYAEIEVEPLWLKLWRQERKTLKPKHRAVLDALLVDMRPRVAARIAGVGKNVIYHCSRKIFKVHFAQCYQAYRALLND